MEREKLIAFIQKYLNETREQRKEREHQELLKSVEEWVGQRPITDREIATQMLFDAIKESKTIKQNNTK